MKKILVEPARMGLGKSFGLVAALTVVSKLFGLARDIVVAGVYGATPIADAYNLAFLFTGNILVLFGGLGGPFHSATVAVLAGRKFDERTSTLIWQMMAISSLLFGFLAILVFAAAPNIVVSMAVSGTRDTVSVSSSHPISPIYESKVGSSHARPVLEQLRRNSVRHLLPLPNQNVLPKLPESSAAAKLPLLLTKSGFVQQTVWQLRVMSPLILIASLIGISYGILTVKRQLFWPSISPILASLAIIIAVKIDPDKHNSAALAAGTLIGACAQLLVQIPALIQCKLKKLWSFRAVLGLKSYIAMLLPAVVGTSIGQITLYVDSSFCLGIPEIQGTLTAVSNANRLIQLPLGVLITAMLVPLLPRLIENAQAKKVLQVKREFRKAVSFLWFVATPITMIMMVIPEALVKALYQRGAWDAQATNLVVTGIIFLAPSIVIYIGRDLTTRVFYAYKDSKTPYYVALTTIALKYLLNWLFVNQLHMGLAGICLATTIITFLNFAGLIFLLKAKIGNLGMISMLPSVMVMLAGALVAGFCTRACFQWAHQFVELQLNGNLNLVYSLAAIAASSACGLLVYALICYLLKLEEMNMIMRKLNQLMLKLRHCS